MPPERASLRARLAASGRDGRFLRGGAGEVALETLLRASVLGSGRDRLSGRNVLISTRDQLLTAVALVEFDEIAARIVLAPPDLEPGHVAAILRAGEVDAVLSDADPGAWPLLPDEAVHRPVWPPHAAPPAGDGVSRAEWILLTSGTTGAPKLARYTLDRLTSPIAAAPAGAEPPVWATFYDIRRYGGLQMYFRGLLGTGSLVLSGPGEPVADFLGRLSRTGVTHLAGTPSHWRRALMSPAIRTVSPRYVRLSGEIADQAILDALKATFPEAAIGHAYASTEAGVAFEVNDGRAGFPAEVIGRSRAGVEIKVEGGSLRVRSPRSALGFLGSDAPFSDADGFIDTGDMVEREDGRWLFVGRRGGIVNVGGLKVHPEEVEAVLNRHPGVRLSLVEGRRSPVTGAIVSARIVRREASGGPDDDAALRADVLRHCRGLLPPHKVPAVLHVVAALDVTAAGKLRRHA